MPDITDGGRTWTIKVKPGIHFADDPVFKGKKRELTAADYVYSWKRLIDPKVRSPFSWYVQGKIVGAEPVIEAAKKTGRFDYDALIEGLQALDRYTLRLKLTEPDYIMLGYMTQSPMAAVAREVIDRAGHVRPPYAERGVALARITQPALQYAYFNMDDPVIGGYSKEKIALRRAISLGFDRPEMIRVVYQGQALPATQPIPPNLPGHDDNWSVDLKYDPAAAKALLDRFGYIDRDGDGYRELPDGKPLTLVMASTPSSRDRDFDELWQKSMKAIGIRIEFLKSKFPDLLKMGKAGQLQLWRLGWINLYAEGDAFVQLLYGPNIGQTNYSRFSLPEYDELYRASRRLPDGPERNKIYRRMSEIVAAYNPWWLGFYTIENTLVQPWVLGYKKHAYWEHPWKYLDVDAARPRSAR